MKVKIVKIVLIVFLAIVAITTVWWPQSKEDMVLNYMVIDKIATLDTLIDVTEPKGPITWRLVEDFPFPNCNQANNLRMVYHPKGSYFTVILQRKSMPVCADEELFRFKTDEKLPSPLNNLTRLIKKQEIKM